MCRLKETFAAAMAAIREMSDALDDEEGLERIYEDPLSIEVRPDWHSIGEPCGAPSAYRILLTTGGPAVRIIGTLDHWAEPETAELEVQDWFEPWRSFPTSDEDDDALMRYAEYFTYVC